MASKHKLICWSCKTEVELTGRATRTDACPTCDNPIKSCYNCKFYDRDAHHQCLETQAEWVRYKEKANFCEYFTPKPLKPASAETKTDANAQAKKPDANETFSLSRQSKARVFTNKKEKDKAAWDSLFKD